jgi:hypothetical protein
MREKSVNQNSFFNRQTAISQILVVVRHSRNDKSQILSLENLRGIVRKSKVRKSANSVVTDSSCYVAKADSSSKIFQPLSLSVFILYYAA